MNKDLNIRFITKILGGLLLVETAFLLIPFFVAIVYREPEWIYFLLTGLITAAFGAAGLFVGMKANIETGKREAAIIVTFTWILYTLFGSLPLWLSGHILAFTDAFFESLSGFTTTGTTILDNIEALPNNMLFWRSLMHWIGGLGIVVFSIALLPLIGGAGYQLFNSESTTPIREKILPKMRGTANFLLITYLIITLLCTIALKIAGMSFFDAVNHALSVVSTGGFSTKQLSIGFWNSPAIEYVIIFFMFFSGINFTLFYFLFKFGWKKVKQNEELKYYVIILLFATGIILFSRIDFSAPFSWHTLEKSFRGSLFIVTSCITTTGLCTEDFTQWSPYTWIVLLVLMISGASTYSTSGGIKVSRVVVLAKFCYYEFRQMLHPYAVFPVRYNTHIIKDDVLMRILAFTIIYCLFIIFGSFILGLSGLGFEESISGMITCMSDVGLGLGKLGPSHSFSEIPIFSKWFLAFVMLVGRLEIYSVLLFFIPDFWKE